MEIEIMNKLHFEIQQRKDDKWYWLLYAQYDELGVCTTGFANEECCREAIMQIKNLASNAVIIPPKTNGQT
jgi:uncharacterized protein YegP (UPF0339 family)